MCQLDSNLHDYDGAMAPDRWDKNRGESSLLVGLKLNEFCIDWIACKRNLLVTQGCYCSMKLASFSGCGSKEVLS